MTPADYKRAGELFEQLREVSEAERPSALDTACAGNSVLRDQVSRLLDADRDAAAGSFLAGKAIEDAARLLRANRPPGTATRPRRALTPGTRLRALTKSPRFLGAGGMGEVYRARDGNLDREVAIKILAATLASDARYMARFEREAKVLASLNHPNIAAIYGIEHFGREQRALVMELVEGENLRGPLPLDEAIPIARQIAVGLEAAHESGVVHRDLKPANIKVTPSGIVKLLDFGLAKSASDSSASWQGTSSPTSPPSSPPDVTQGGTIMGTAAYMSPEQARGKPVDKRTDIWTFGVVLYELLTGRQLLSGSENIATALESLPAETPAHIRRLLARCLRKGRSELTRLRDIGEARLMLDDPDETSTTLAQTAGRRGQRAWLPLVFGRGCARDGRAASGGALAASASKPRTRQRCVSQPCLRKRRPSPRSAFLPFLRTGIVWPSPRGAKANRSCGYAISIRSTRGWFPGTEGAVDPFWSPDSRFVAFFVPGKLKKVDIGGSPAVTLCDAADGRGGSWNQNDVILFAPNFGAPLSRVPAAGVNSTPLTTLDEAAGETSHRFPVVPSRWPALSVHGAKR